MGNDLEKQKHIIALSDTHSKHRQIVLPQGMDMLIHCGDACTDGNQEELEDFFEWFSLQKATDKIFIAGNHDYFADDIFKNIPYPVIFWRSGLLTLLSK